MLRTVAPYALFVVCTALAAGMTVAWPGLAAAQVRISSLPGAAALTGAELLPAVQNGADVVVTPAQIRSFTGGGGGAATPGGLTGQLQYNSASTFAGFTLAGDCALSVPTIVCTKTNGVAFGSFATQNAAAPPAIGGATPAAGAFTSLSASGALTTNVTGATQCLRVNASGVVTGTGADCWTPTASYAGKPSNPAATTSTSLVMAGLAGAITPTATGRVLITMSGDAYTATAGAQINMGMYYGTGSAPANGASVTGAALNTPIRHRASGTTIPVAFSMTYAVTGLTPGVAYWMDIAFDTGTAADAATLENVSITAVEF